MAAPPGFHVLAKPTGPACNLACEYCFFLDKSELYPERGFRMSDELLETYLTELFEAHLTRDITVAWQGGEPTLMGVEFFSRAVAVAERLRRPGQRVTHTLQTNGTLLDDAWGELFAAHDVLIGISIDGPPAVHDRYRVDRHGRPTSDRVLAGLDVLRRHGVEWNVLCTVHRANQHDPLGVYRYLRDELGASFVQLIPIVEHDPAAAPADGAVSSRSVEPGAWGRFLIEVFDEWVAKDVGEVFVSYFDAAVASWAGVSPAMCIFAETCGDALAITHNGDVYSCDHFVDPDHLLGNVSRTHLVELVAAPAQRRFGDDKRDQLTEACRRCDVRFACQGECPRNRFVSSPDGEPGHNYLCEGYFAWFHHADTLLRAMADAVTAGRPATTVMDSLRRAGRNDPCPCGSGSKAKHCHQR